jgi:ABC-type transport system substrate-binding protein
MGRSTIERISDNQELSFVLKKPYPLFIETLSLGIVPKHVWKDLTDEQISLSDLNINAVGSGPYAR